MDGWMVVLDVEMFPKQSPGEKTDGHKADRSVRLKVSGCRLFVRTTRGLFHRSTAWVLFFI